MAKSYLQLNDTIATFVDEHNSLVNKVGDLANLATTGDSDLIQSINEIITERTAFPSNFIPDADGTRNLGADATRWNATYHDYARVTNNIHVGNGSAATPAYAFEGDTNTGLYRSAADELSISTGGVERMRVDDSGNVGIGTSSPSEALTVIGNGVFGNATTKYNTITINGGHVDDGDNDYGLTINSFEPAITLLDRSTGAGSSQILGLNNGGLLFRGDTTNDGTIGHTANTTDFIIAQFEPEVVKLFTSESERMRIDSNGNVGIGTVSPSSKLDVNGDVTITDKIIHSGDTNTSIRFPANDTFTVETAGSERMRIDNNGNVGIGTTNTSLHSLHVAASGTGAKDIFRVSSGGGGSFQIRCEDLAAADPTWSLRTFHDEPIAFKIATTEVMRLSANGNVGIGTTSPTSPLDVNGDVTITDKIIHSGDTNTSIRFPANDTFTVETAGSERMRIDNSGNVGIGTTLPTEKLDVNGTIQGTFITSTGSIYATNGLIRTSDGSAASPSVQPGIDADTGLFRPASNTIGFSTSGVERMRIDNSGNVLVGTTNSSPATNNVFGHVLSAYGSAHFSRSGSSVVNVNRQEGGTLVIFYNGGTTAGYITVVGTTVSYVGGHLSRWSQTADNTRIDGLLKGTVLTNLDQMAVWSHETTYWTEGDDLPEGVAVGDVRREAYVEENEQLNCMAISSVEGDPNVAGVFVNWDDDDGGNDMNVAMTGDMIIRIAQGTTVQRGDLLMSAGDGTAKPQGDDIVRSKTIAKVISTHVTCTYGDGSYCIPCVLMAC